MKNESSLITLDELREHLATVKKIYQKDREAGVDGVYLPFALDRKYPNAGKEWAWFWVFPSGRLSIDPRNDAVRRYHIHPSALQKEFKAAVKRAGIAKRATVHTLRHYAEFRTMPSNHISSLRMNDLFMFNSA